MNKRKIVTSVIVIISALVLASGLCGCADQESATGVKALPSPENLSIDRDEVVTWSEVENADGYEVRLNDVTYYTTEPKIDLFMEIVSPYEQTISVKAISKKENFADSFFSEEIKYTVPKLTKLLSSEIEDGREYQIKVQDPYAIEGKFALPETVNGKPITKIAANAFENCDKLTGIILPESITTILSGAFRSCDRLKMAVISDNVNNLTMTDIFKDCVSLKKIILPKRLEKLTTGIFNGCKSLKEIYVPRCVKEIKGGGFPFCDALEKIEVDEANETYLSQDNCIIEKSDDKMIVGCKTSVIPEYVGVIGRQAFHCCSGLKEITIPSHVKTIEGGCFRNCPDLEKVTIEDGVEILGTILSNRFSDGDSVFYGCDKIKEIYIPRSVKEIAGTPFSHCDSLEKITVDEENEFYRSEGQCIISADNEVVAGCNHSVIPDGVTKIGDYAFYMMTFGHFVVPSDVKTIGEYAFAENENLTGIDLHEGLEKIDYAAFENCYDMDFVSIPRSVKEIGEYAFFLCCCTLTLPKTVETFYKNTFCSCVVYTDYSVTDENASILKEYYTYTHLDCTFANDNGDYYVSTIEIKHTITERTVVGNVETTKTIRYGSYPVIGGRLPQREGYLFKGWSTEVNGEIIFPIEKKEIKLSFDSASGAHTLDIYRYHSWDFSVVKGLPDESVLYAVWEKI